MKQFIFTFFLLIVFTGCDIHINGDLYEVGSLILGIALALLAIFISIYILMWSIVQLYFLWMTICVIGVTFGLYTDYVDVTIVSVILLAISPALRYAYIVNEKEILKKLEMIWVRKYYEMIDNKSKNAEPDVFYTNNIDKNYLPSTHELLSLLTDNHLNSYEIFEKRGYKTEGYKNGAVRFFQKVNDNYISISLEQKTNSFNIQSDSKNICLSVIQSAIEFGFSYGETNKIDVKNETLSFLTSRSIISEHLINDEDYTLDHDDLLLEVREENLIYTKDICLNYATKDFRYYLKGRYSYYDNSFELIFERVGEISEEEFENLDFYSQSDWEDKLSHINFGWLDYGVNLTSKIITKSYINTKSKIFNQEMLEIYNEDDIDKDISLSNGIIEKFGLDPAKNIVGILQELNEKWEIEETSKAESNQPKTELIEKNKVENIITPQLDSDNSDTRHQERIEDEEKDRTSVIDKQETEDIEEISEGSIIKPNLNSDKSEKDTTEKVSQSSLSEKDIETLTRLKELLDKEILTTEEFLTEKSKVLNKQNS